MASYWTPTGYNQQQQQQSESVLPADIEEFLQSQPTYPEPAFPQSQPARFEEVTTTGTKKRRREGELGLEDYAKVSQKLRRLDQSQLQTIGDWQQLADCKPGEVLVVDAC